MNGDAVHRCKKEAAGNTGNRRKVTKILPKIAILHQVKGRNKGIHTKNEPV